MSQTTVERRWTAPIALLAIIAFSYGTTLAVQGFVAARAKVEQKMEKAVGDALAAKLATPCPAPEYGFELHVQRMPDGEEPTYECSYVAQHYEGTLLNPVVRIGEWSTPR